MRAARVLLCALAAVAFPCLAAAQPQRFLDHGVRLSITARTSQPTQRVAVAWGGATDGRLSADLYHVSMRLLGDTAWRQDFTTTILSRTVDVPLKPYHLDSVGLYVVVHASRKGVRGADSVWGLRWFRRSLSTKERASLDSFPEANRRFLICTRWGRRQTDAEIARSLALNLRRKTTAIDSAHERNHWEAIRTGPDSIYTPPPTGPGDVLFKGYRYPWVFAGKNRYTGRVRPLDADSVWSTNPEVLELDDHDGTVDPTCVNAMAAWEAERSG